MIPINAEESRNEAAESAADSSNAPLEPTITSSLASEAVEPLPPSGSASKFSDIEVEMHVDTTLDCLGDWPSNDEFENYSDSDSLMPRKPKTGHDTASLSLDLLSICSGSTYSLTGEDQENRQICGKLKSGNVQICQPAKIKTGKFAHLH